MTDPKSIHAFINSLKSHTDHLDHAILNAGTIQTTHTVASEYETTIRINTISTALLALLVLPLLLASPLTTQASIDKRPHLSIVSSALSWMTKLEGLRPQSTSDTPLADLSTKESFPSGAMGGQTQYGRSKLLLEYSIRPIAALPSLLTEPSNPKSTPKVIVSSLCKSQFLTFPKPHPLTLSPGPGLCRSDLGRQFSEGFWLKRVLLQFAMYIIARPASAGANTYITSLETGIEAKGEIWRNDHVNYEEIEKNVRSEEGKEVGWRVWREVRAVMLKEDQTGVVKNLLGE